MKKFLFLLLVVPTVAWGQVYPPDASSGTATSVSSSAFPLLAPDGALSAPSYSFTNYTGMGCLAQAGPNLLCQNKAFPTNNGRSSILLGEERWQLSAYNTSDTTQLATFVGIDDSGMELRFQTYADTDDYSFFELRPTTYDFRFSVAGSETSYFSLSTSAATFAVPAKLPNGTQAAKSLQGSAADVGIMFLATPAVSAEAADRSNDEATGYWSISSTLGHFGFSDTAVEVTGLQANVTGWSLVVDDVVDLSSNGSAVSSTLSIRGPQGATATPSWSFTSDTDMGCFDGQFGVFTCQSATGTTDRGELVLDDGAAWFFHTDSGGQDSGLYASTDAAQLKVNDVVAFGMTTSVGQLGTGYSLGFEGATDDANDLTLGVEDPTGTRSITLQDESGYVETVQQGTSTLTDATATNILSFPLAASATEFAAGSIHLVTKCTDNTNTIFRHDTVDFICKNISDTETCAFQTNLGSALDLVEGTAAFSTHTIASDSSATNTVEFTLDADCTLTPTVLETRWEIEFHQPFWAAVTELN